MSGASQADAEIWLPVPGYECLYQISSQGRVRSLHFGEPRLIAQTTDQSGYPVVQLSASGRRRPFTVHRLACRAFHGEPAAGLEAAHLDGDRKNSAANNLAWVTKLENHAHKRIHGTHGAGDNAGHRKLRASQVSEIRARKGGAPARIVATDFGVSTSAIYDIWNGKRWGSVHESAVGASRDAQPHPGDSN